MEMFRSDTMTNKLILITIGLSYSNNLFVFQVSIFCPFSTIILMRASSQS